MDVLLDSGLLMDPAVLAVLTESGPGGKKRRKVVIPQPRRGELEGHGQVRWRIPIQPGVWEELERDGVDDPSSWAGKRFRSIFGVPKAIYDELVYSSAAFTRLRMAGRIQQRALAPTPLGKGSVFESSAHIRAHPALSGGGPTC